MEKVQSLAEYLGVDSSDGLQAEPPGPRLEDISDPKEFAHAVLNSQEFRSYIVSGLVLGNVPGFTGILTRLMDHAWGKPVERLVVQDATERLEDLTPEVVQAKLERVQKMLRLVQFTHSKEEHGASVH